MTQQQMVADAIKELSKEKQEAEIKKIKDIVQRYLEKIDTKKKEVKESQEELRALEKDLDDLKDGRLDKIEERQGKDVVHDRVKIIEVHRIETQYIPMQPWRSPWEITYYYPTGTYCFSTGSTTLGLGSVTTTTSGNCLGATQTTGVTFQNFASGNYQVGGNSINL